MRENTKKLELLTSIRKESMNINQSLPQVHGKISNVSFTLACKEIDRLEKSIRTKAMEILIDSARIDKSSFNVANFVNPHYKNLQNQVKIIIRSVAAINKILKNSPIVKNEKETMKSYALIKSKKKLENLLKKLDPKSLDNHFESAKKMINLSKAEIELITQNLSSMERFFIPSSS